MSSHPQIERLLAYQAASNHHVSAVSIGFFSEDGLIAMDGKEFMGPQALLDAHEFDRGSGTLITLSDFVVEDNHVTCAFRTENDFDRLLDTGGTQGSARFTFAGDLIQRFEIFPPSDAERSRLRELIGPAITWVRTNHPNLLAQSDGFNYRSGKVISDAAALYAQRHAMP